jgi:hypothetical protein
VAPSAATSFLNLIAITDLKEIAAAREADPITKGYFRHYEARPMAARGSASRGADDAGPGPHKDDDGDDSAGARRARARLDAALKEIEPPASPGPARTAGLLAAGDTPAATGDDAPEDWSATLLRRALAGLRARDVALAERRLIELSYLANVVIAGCRWSDRRVRPAEAAGVVMTIAGSGLSWVLERARTGGKRREGDGEQRAATDAVAANDVVKLFRIGWKLRDGRDDLPVGLRWDRR